MNDQAIIFCVRCPLSGIPCAGPCPCTVDRVDIARHAEAHYCPHPDGPRFGDGVTPEGWDQLVADATSISSPPRPPAEVAAWQAQAAASLRELYHELWNELHRRPLVTTDLAAEPAALEAIIERLPGGETCGCKADARRRLHVRPPDVRTRWTYAVWCFEFHDGISADLGNPRITLEEATRIRGWGGLIEPASTPDRSTIEGR